MALMMGIGPHAHVGLLLRRAVHVGGERSLRTAAEAMRDANVSAVLVGDVGILTERDLTRALAAGLGPDTPCGDISVTDLVCVSPEATVIEAAAEMLHHEIRHLVVRDDEGVAGVLSLRDLMAVLLDTMDPAVWVVLKQALTSHSEIWLG